MTVAARPPRPAGRDLLDQRTRPPRPAGRDLLDQRDATSSTRRPELTAARPHGAGRYPWRTAPRPRRPFRRTRRGLRVRHQGRPSPRRRARGPGDDHALRRSGHQGMGALQGPAGHRRRPCRRTSSRTSPTSSPTATRSRASRSTAATATTSCGTRAAHVLAQAVQDLFPDAKLGIGPPIKDGFYYDFDVEMPFHPDDLAKIETRMRKIIKDNQRFSRRVTNDDDARVELAGRALQARADRPQGRAQATRPRAPTPRSAPASSPSTTTSTATARSPGRTSAAARTCPPRSGSRRSS